MYDTTGDYAELIPAHIRMSLDIDESFIEYRKAFQEFQYAMNYAYSV